MENPFSVLQQENFEEGEQIEIDYFQLISLKPDVKVQLTDSNFKSRKFKKSVNLFTCSSIYGFFVAASNSGFAAGLTKSLRSSIYKADRSQSTPFEELISVPVKEGEVNIVSLSFDSLQLFVGVSGGTLLTYNICDIVKNKENAVPAHTFNLGKELVYIQPNPEFDPDVIAILTEGNECKLIRFKTSQTIATLPNTTTMSWSPKGKQIACGTKDGSTIAYDLQGTAKDTITAPSSLTGMHVSALLWIENHEFLAIYSKNKITEAGEEEVELKPYIINRKAKDESDKYKLLGEVTPIFGDDIPESHFYITIIRQLGINIKNLIVLANSSSGEVAAVGQEENGEWSTWMIDNSPTFPLADDSVTDTFPVGLSVDFSASEPLPPYDTAESEAGVPAMPVIFFMTNVGRICAYHAYNEELARTGSKYSKMVDAKDFTEIPEPSSAPITPEATATASAFTASPSPPTVSGFGIQKNIPSFNSFKVAAAGATKSPISSPSLNQASPTTAPKFGSTSFGSPSFGSSTAPFGQQTVPFAQLARSSSTGTSAATASATAFGYNGTTNVTRPSGLSALGKSASFGSSSAFSTASFGSTGFGNSTFSSTSAFVPKITAEDPSNPFGKPSFNSSSIHTMFAPSKLESKSTDESTKENAEPEKSKETAEAGKPTEAEKPKEITVNEKPAEDTVPTEAEKKNDISNMINPSPLQSVQKHIIEGVPTPTVLTKDEESEEDKDDSCNISFESVKHTLDDNDEHDEISSFSSDISKVSSIDKSTDPYEFSLHSISDALGDVDNTQKRFAVKELDDEEDYLVSDQDTEGEAEKDEPHNVEAKRIALEAHIAEEKVAAEDQKRLDQKAEEKKCLAEQEKKAVEDKVRRELAERKSALEKKLREDAEKKAALEKRRAEEAAERKRLEEEHAAEEKRLEEEKLEAERIAELERLAVIKPDPKFAVRQRKELATPNIHDRTPGIDEIAKKFEEVYFSTNEDLESTTIQLFDIQQELYFQAKTNYSLDLSYLEDDDYEWKMIEMYDTVKMIEKLEQDVEKARIGFKSLSKSVTSLADSTNNLKTDELKLCLEELNDKKESQVYDTIKDTLEDELDIDLHRLQTKTAENEKALDDLEKQLSNCKETLKSSVSTCKQTESKFTMYILRRTMRDIERSTTEQINKISMLEQQELSLRLSNDKHHSNATVASGRVQRGVFLKELYNSSIQVKPL